MSDKPLRTSAQEAETNPYTLKVTQLCQQPSFKTGLPLVSCRKLKHWVRQFFFLIKSEEGLTKPVP